MQKHRAGGPPPRVSGASAGQVAFQQLGRLPIGPNTPLGLLFGVPLLAHLLVACGFAFAPDSPVIPAIAALLILVIGLAVSSIFEKEPGKAKEATTSGTLPAWFPIAAVCLAVGTGALTGVRAHEAFARQYFAAAYGDDYTSLVVASSPGAAYADAGRIRFADTSAVSVAKAVGYMERSVYCAAPVLDTGAEQTRRISFWAVGMDCCDQRGSFECGGGANSRGGVRLTDDSFLDNTKAAFMKAVDQAAAIHELVVDDTALLILWSKDPDSVAFSYLLRTFTSLLLGALLFVLLVLVGVVTALVRDIDKPAGGQTQYGSV